MADPLSVTGTAVGIVSLGIQITSSLVSFYTSYKARDSDLVRIIGNLNSLETILRILFEALSTRRFKTGEQELVQRVQSLVEDCNDLIEELGVECKRFQESSSGTKAAIKQAGRRIIYPFRQSTLQKLTENVAEICTNITLALDVLQLRDNKSIEDDIADARSLLELISISQVSSDILGWFKAPDASVSHNAVYAKRNPGSGMWLIRSPAFQNWLEQANSFLWLNGFAGSGKSVLCSTAILFSSRQRKQRDKSIGIAFFYFTFNDESKQDVIAMLKALIVQLSAQLLDHQEELSRLYRSYKPGMPPTEVIMDSLRRIIQKFDQVYILLDALDESPEKRERAKVLFALEEIRKWSLEGLHLLVTSRDEQDIRDSLDPLDSQNVMMRNHEVDVDIANFVSRQLLEDRTLQKWSKYRDRIEEALSKGAKGVFRWVECQFQSLRSCPRSEFYLERLLTSLPESLDQTYEQMLCRIDHISARDVRRVLLLLCFARGPLTVSEIIDGIAVEIDDPVQLKCKRRLQDASDIREICAGLVEIYDSEVDYGEGDDKLIRIAHFSVQEYLVSDRIRESSAASFGLERSEAHQEIAQICLIYLLEPCFLRPEVDESPPREHLLSDFDEGFLAEYPLANYAANFWYDHFQEAPTLDPRVLNLALQLLVYRRQSLASWIRLIDYGPKTIEGQKLLLAETNVAISIYFASVFGLHTILKELLNTGQQESSLGRDYSLAAQTNARHFIDCPIGHLGNALQAACSEGHERSARLLLEWKANVNAYSGLFGTALQAASSAGYEDIVRLLLEMDADVDLQGGYYGSPLHAASAEGYETTVRLLLDKKPNVNAQGGTYGTALQAASFKGFDTIVQLLLDQDADVNIQAGYFGTALQAASYEGHDVIVRLLLEKDANVNIRAGDCGTALQAASSRQHEAIVRLLLEKQADVNLLGGCHSTALLAATGAGNATIVDLLLENGADPNTQTESGFSTAIETAAAHGYEKITKLLLDRKANVTKGAICQAVDYENLNVCRLLLERGDPPGAVVEAGFYAAVGRGNEETVAIFLAANPVIKTQMKTINRTQCHDDYLRRLKSELD